MSKPIEILPRTVNAFFRQTIRGEGCWLWDGSKSEKGYGLIGINRKILKAHRVSYLMHKGDIPQGMLIMHSCDNPSCVNPDHLSPGTHKDNHDDMVKKGRGQVKLTVEDVKLARLLHSQGHGYKRLARQFGVSPKTMRQAINRITWKHV